MCVYAIAHIRLLCLTKNITMKTLLRISLFVVISILFLYFIFNFITREKNIVFNEGLYDQQRIKPRPCFANMEGSYWSCKINDTLRDYDLRNPIFCNFSLRARKKIQGDYPKGSTWKIEGDTLFILSKSNTYKYILEGCPPKCTIIYFDSIDNNYKRQEMYAMF